MSRKKLCKYFVQRYSLSTDLSIAKSPHHKSTRPQCFENRIKAGIEITKEGGYSQGTVVWLIVQCLNVIGEYWRAVTDVVRFRFLYPFASAKAPCVNFVSRSEAICVDVSINVLKVDPLQR